MFALTMACGVIMSSSLCANAVKIRIRTSSNNVWVIIPSVIIAIILVIIGIITSKKKGTGKYNKNNPYKNMDLYKNKNDPMNNSSFDNQNTSFGGNSGYSNQNTSFGGNNGYSNQNTSFGSSGKSSTYSTGTGFGEHSFGSMDDYGSQSSGSYNDSYGGFSGTGKPFEDLPDGSFDSGLGNGFADNDPNNKNW